MHLLESRAINTLSSYDLCCSLTLTLSFSLMILTSFGEMMMMITMLPLLLLGNMFLFRCSDQRIENDEPGNTPTEHSQVDQRRDR